MNGRQAALPILLALTLIAPGAGAQDAAPPAAGSDKTLSLEYQSPLGFAKEYQSAKTDLTKVYIVTKDRPFRRDVFEASMDGYFLARSPVKGVTFRGYFVGTGNVSLVPPNDVEVIQLKRFWSKAKDSGKLEFEFTGADIGFAGREEEQFFLGFPSKPLAEVEEQVKKEKSDLEAKAEKTDEEKKRLRTLSAFLKRVGDIREGQKKTPERDALEQERASKLDEHMAAFARQVYGESWQGPWSFEMDLPLPDNADPGAAYLTQIGVAYDPWDIEGEEFYVWGVRDYGRQGKSQSLWCRFARSADYEPDLKYTGTSRALQAKDLTAVHFTDYRIVITLEKGTKRLQCRSRAKMLVKQDGLRLVPINLFPLYIVKEAKFADGTPLEIYRPELPGATRAHAYQVYLHFPEPLKKGEVKELDMSFEGDVLEYATNGTWVIAEGTQWFPTYGYLMPAYFDATFNAPEGLTVAAGGHPAPCDPVDQVPGYVCKRWVHLDNEMKPVKTYIEAFNVAENMVMTEGMALNGKTKIEVYANRDAERPFRFCDSFGNCQEKAYNMSKTRDEIVALIQLSLDTYEQNFGPFPFTKLAVTPHPKGYGQGPGSILLISDFAYLTSTALKEITSFFEARGFNANWDAWRTPHFIAHETAHQWWGNAVCWKSGRDQWVSEGFSDYSASLVLERMDAQYGTKYRDQFMKEEMAALIVDDRYPDSLGPIVVGNRHPSRENREGYQNYRQQYLYHKGCFLMAMMRTVFRAKMRDDAKGDEAFRAMFTDFINTYHYGNPSNLDFQQIVTKHMGGFGERFFRQWVYGNGIPKIEFSWQVAQGADGKYQLNGRIRQVDTDFQFPVSVNLHRKEGKAETSFKFYAPVGKKDYTFSTPLDFKPDRVTLNDDYGLLAVIENVPWTGTQKAEVRP